MKIIVDGDKIRVHVTGLKLLKLKSAITSRIGGLVSSGKNHVSFPLSVMHVVSDLLPEINLTDPVIEEHLEKYTQHKMARTKALSIMEGEATYELPEYWQNILDPAQQNATAAMTIPNLLGLCLFDEQGSGKTVMTIASFDILIDRCEIDAMIVVCPKSMISEWTKEIARFCPNTYKVVKAEGTKQNKYDATLKDFDVIVTNFEGVEAMLVTLKAAAASRKFLLVIDESYYLKNSESMRSEHTTHLRNASQRCFVLCGTPAPNTAHDLINQFDLADLKFTFGGFHKSRNPESDWDNISLLIDTRGLFIRRLKTDILDHVPEKYFHVLRVELTGKQKLMYELARTELEIELKKFNNETFKKSLATYFQKRAAMLQICSCPGAIDPILSETPVKFQILDELLGKLIGQGRKVIIWSYYRRSLEDIYSRYTQYNPVRVDGSVSTELRKEAVELFQENPDTMLFIGNPAAAGAGITLHSSYDAVYFSYSNQAAHYLQSLDRIHRRGQVSDEVNYYLLVCKNTVEETEVVRLRDKEVRQHDLLGDHIKWPTSIDDALSELKSHD